MKKNLLKIISSMLAVSLTLVLFLNAIPADKYSDYKEYQSKREELIAENEKLNAEVGNIGMQIDEMYAQIEANNQAGSDLTLKEQSYNALLTACLQQLASERELLAVTDELIATVDAEIMALEDRQVYLEKSLVKTVRSLHENDGLGYVEFLLGSTDIVDLLNRFEYLTSIVEYHDTLLADVEQNTVELNSKRDECLALKTKQEESLVLLESRRVKYDEIISECMNSLSELSSDSLALENLINQREEDIAALEKEQADLAESLKDVNQSIDNFEYNNWFWPGDDSYITCYYGYDVLDGEKRYHRAIDINLRYENVYAARAGKVVYAKYNNGGYGYMVGIDHGNGIQTYYAHLSKILVKVGQVVGARELIGVSGNTGLSSGPHLHFEILVNGTKVNPLNCKSIGITGKSSYYNLP